MKRIEQSCKTLTFHLFVMILCLIIFTISPAFSREGPQRGLKKIQVKQQDNTLVETELYQESHALIIGVSQYNNGWTKLPGVIEDVIAVKTKLGESGFTVTVVMDPDSNQLKQSFENFISQFGNNPNNRLLFYFAGHGHTIMPAYGGDPIGYIVPKDAPLPKVDSDMFKRKAMSIQRVEEFARLIDSKHAMFLFDSCFSGSLFALSRAVPQDISYKTVQPVRQFITSGQEDEQVSDKSIFRRQFIAGLNGEADSNNDGYITGTELSTFLQTSVINYSKGYQHPQYGKIRHPKLDKGDFVFAVTPGNLTMTTDIPTNTNQNNENTISLTTVDVLIKNLAKRYMNNDVLTPSKRDTWLHNKSIVVVFLDVEGSGTSQGERNYIIDDVSEKMRESGRYTIVEREILDKLIAELQLSNSDLANPKTSLKLGKILSASLIATGSLNRKANNWLVSLRFIDTETTSIRCSVSSIVKNSNPEQVVTILGQILENKLKKEFPLQGVIITVDATSTAINIGAKSGIKKNMTFEILDNEDMPIANIQIEKVGPMKSIARINDFIAPLKNGMRVREVIGE